MLLLHLGPLHLGPLHPAGQALTLLLAFGPVLLLAATIWITRRRKAEDSEDVGAQGSGA